MPPVFLLVDDDDGCPILLRAAMEKAAIECVLQYVVDGKEAMDYLNGAGKYQDRNRFPMPSLVLLDLKMPNANGFDVLRWKSHHRSLDWLPVVVWSTADVENDQQEAINLGADSYLIKPMKLQDLMGVARKLLDILVRHQASFVMVGKPGARLHEEQTGSSGE
jgi:DNA-binding response OmpR family regulator